MPGLPPQLYARSCLLFMPLGVAWEGWQAMMMREPGNLPSYTTCNRGGVSPGYDAVSSVCATQHAVSSQENVVMHHFKSAVDAVQDRAGFRVTALPDDPAGQAGLEVIRRDGTVAPFQAEKISIALS